MGFKRITSGHFCLDNTSGKQPIDINYRRQYLEKRAYQWPLPTTIDPSLVPYSIAIAMSIVYCLGCAFLSARYRRPVLLYVLLYLAVLIEGCLLPIAPYPARAQTLPCLTLPCRRHHAEEAKRISVEEGRPAFFGSPVQVTHSAHCGFTREYLARPPSRIRVDAVSCFFFSF